jgi:hypothetical protein
MAVKLACSPITSKRHPSPKADSCIVHTLGQVGHNQCQQGFQPIVKDLKYLQKRAKNAYFSKSLARYLTQLDTPSPLLKAYKRTLFDCCGSIMQEGKKLTSKYCDARWCNTCNRIRTAKLMNGYLPVLAQFKEMYFVTLTVPNVNKADLKPCIVGMIRTASNVIKARRRSGNACNGIRKLECTYNSIEDTYHPHFHLIVDGFDNASFILNEWLKRYPNATTKAQDLCKADVTSARELFKYTTKIVSKSKADGFRIYVPALDVIFQAMYKVRTFQSFGKVRMVSENIESIEADEYEQIPNYEFMLWVWKDQDWFSMATGEPLTYYKPSTAMQQLVTEKMVT